MSRRRALDNTVTVSLFPFLAVLLCTMGALVVVLVGMSHTARDAALRQPAKAAEPTLASATLVHAQQLDQVKQYAELLGQLRVKSQQSLRQDQQRLGDMEAHMRQLQDELRQLAIASAELDALGEEHYDDRQQAQREVTRLQKLIASTKQSIEELKSEQPGKKRSFALMPYEGPNGTLRRPMFIECRDGAIVLQPEGVQITEHDLRSPIGAGNALASAMRAARGHYIGQNPAEGQSRDTEPYPLVIVRPSGAGMFNRVQKAIQSADLDFGYELVEEDWDLQYPSPNPQLALVEQMAIDQARIRQEALAAAAPRAYGDPVYAVGGRFDTHGGGGSGPALAGFGTGPIDLDALQTGPYASDGAGNGIGGYGVASGGAGGPGDATAAHEHGASEPSADTLGGQGGPAAEGPMGLAEGAVQGTATQSSGTAMQNNQIGVGTSKHHSDPYQSTGFSTDQMPGMEPDASDVTLQFSPGQKSGSAGSPSPQTSSPQKQFDPETFKKMEDEWRRKHPRAVPVQRNIEVLIRRDQLAVISAESPTHGHLRTGKSIPVPGDTVLAMDEFANAVRDEVANWGIAGADLYWRPALLLRVAPGGEQRAADLQRLMAKSGLEVRVADAADRRKGGPRATR